MANDLSLWAIQLCQSLSSSFPCPLDGKITDARLEELLGVGGKSRPKESSPLIFLFHLGATKCQAPKTTIFSLPILLGHPDLPAHRLSVLLYPCKPCSVSSLRNIPWLICPSRSGLCTVWILSSSRVLTPSYIHHTHLCVGQVHLKNSVFFCPLCLPLLPIRELFLVPSASYRTVNSVTVLVAVSFHLPD